MMQENNLDTVVLLAHINPDGDAAGSVMGLAHYIKHTYPMVKVIPYLSDKLDKGSKKQVLQDQTFMPFEKPDLVSAYGAVICDTATVERIFGKDYYAAAASTIVLDHHASNEGYGDVNYTNIAESCAENIFYMLDQEALKKTVIPGEGSHAAEYIYLGMIHDTDGFDRADTRGFHAASSLLQMGVSHKNMMKTLKTQTFEDLQKRMEILQKTICVMDGKVAYVFMTREECDEKGIGYEDIHPISGVLRDCEDIELGFTFYEEEKGLWRCSFRSDGIWINVNELMNPFGGGGHAGAAGLRKKTDQPEQLIRDILSRVSELRKSASGGYTPA